MSLTIKQVIKQWRSINRVPTNNAELDHLCATADTITDWCHDNAPEITAVHECKELVLRWIRRRTVSAEDLQAAWEAAHGACSQIERLLKRRKAESSKIPPQHRSEPMTIKRAATLMGYTTHHGDRNAVDILSRSIHEGLVKAEKINRQNYVFDRRDFPEQIQTQRKST
jgi:hypothetical protein